MATFDCRSCLLLLVIALAGRAAGENVIDLTSRAGGEGQTVIVLGHSQAGDGGGGIFYWEADTPASTADGGTIVAAQGSGVWKRIYTGAIEAAWFGVTSTVKPTTEDITITAQRTTRLQAALEAARGNVLRFSSGIYYISDTLIVPENTRLEGAGPMDVWSDAPGGTTLMTAGAGNPQAWQDTGDPRKDVMTPLLVFGGNNVRVSNLGLHTGDNGSQWDIGILMPSVKRCALDHVAVDGPWKVAACLLDATWSSGNKRMIELHEGRIHPSHMNECDIYSCFLSGYNGLMIRGATERNPDDFPGDQWIWSWGGTSDINVISCRLEAKGSAGDGEGGAAYFNDAPMVNAARAGQGHRIIACNLRTKNAPYMVYLKHSNRDRFTSCYFEAQYSDDKRPQTLMHNEPPTTGVTTFTGCKFVRMDMQKEWHKDNVTMSP